MPFYLLLVIVAIAALVGIAAASTGGSNPAAGSRLPGRCGTFGWEALTGCVVVVVGGPILFSAMPQIWLAYWQCTNTFHPGHVRGCLFAVLAFTALRRPGNDQSRIPIRHSAPD